MKWKRIPSIFAVLCVILPSLTLHAAAAEAPVSDASDSGSSHYLAFASDLHGLKNEPVLQNAMKGFPSDTEYVSLIGDLVGDGGGDAPAYDASDIYAMYTGIFPGIPAAQTSIIWADHDAGVTDNSGLGIVKWMGGKTSGVICEGKNTDGSTAYYVYGVGFYHMLDGGTESIEAAATFKNWVAGIDESIPVFVLCHAPIVAKRGDNYGATYWNEALNYAATGVEGITTTETAADVVRNVIYLYGHNHTVDKTEYVYQPGMTMKVQIDASTPRLMSSGNIKVIEGYDEEYAELEMMAEEEAAEESSESETAAEEGGESATLLAAPGGNASDKGAGKGKTKAEGIESNVYYTAMIPGYLKTSGNASLIEITDKEIVITKYNGGSAVSLGNNGETGEQLGSTITITRVAADSIDDNPDSDDSDGTDEGAGNPDTPVYVHEHNYVWKVLQDATSNKDGELALVCRECGAVQQRIPLTGYAVFVKETADKIRNASAGETVSVQTDRWISINSLVLDALKARPDVSLTIGYLYQGQKGELTIPAGTDTDALKNDEGYAGFLYLESVLAD